MKGRGSCIVTMNADATVTALFVLTSSITPTISSDCVYYCKNLSVILGIQPPLNQTCICNPLAENNFEDIISSIINFILKVALVLAPLMAVVAGFLFITASGNVQQITQAKSLLIWAAVGLLTMLFSKGILAIIKAILGI